MPTDCLVLKIEEFDCDTRKKDTTLFVFYDSKIDEFIIRGKRVNNSFSFKCVSSEDLAEFITFTICTRNLWTFVLYSYDNLPIRSDDIDFDFLTTHLEKCLEISAYDQQKYSWDQLLQNLRMLRNVSNEY